MMKRLMLRGLALAFCVLVAAPIALAQSVGGNASLSATTSSTRVAIPASKATYPFLLLAPAAGSSQEIFYAAGDVTVVATTAGAALPAGGVCLAAGPSTYVAAIVATGTATMRITQVSQCPLFSGLGGGGSGGGVTSVGLALPDIFAVTGSPVTSAGTLTGTLATQSANVIWAGPTTGSAAGPVFRAMVVADLPTGIPNANLANAATTVNGQTCTLGSVCTATVPIATGVTGLGTGVATALVVNVGSAGAVVVNAGALGTPSSGVATNLTGTAAGLTAGHVTTNANLTGPITSVGNATSVAAQTGTGSTFVMSAGPTVTNLVIGAGAAITSSGAGGALGSNAFTSTAYLPLTGGTLTGFLGINLNAASLQSPQTGTVLQLANADGVATRLEIDAFGAQAFFTGVCANGTKATPTTMTADTQCGGYNMFGYNGTAFVGPAATFRTFAAQTWSVGVQGAYAEVATTTNGGNTLATRMRWENDGGVTVPSTVTGGSKGSGTVNATGLYQANVQVATLSGAEALTNKTVNGNTFTAGTYTLTGVAAKTLTFNNSLTLAGTDATTMTFPTTSATIARTDAAQTFSGGQTFSNGIVVGAVATFSWTSGAILTSPATATLQHGAADAASPNAQTIKFQSVVAGNANTAAPSATFQFPLSNGSGGGGDAVFKTTQSVAGSGVQNTAATAITFKGGDQSIIMASATDATSTSTGALQIAGGVSITKRVFTAGLTASAGLQTAVLCLSSANEIIADSVACLASSERFKQDIVPSDLGLAAVMAMRPIVYRYAPTGNARFDEAPNQRDIHAGFRAEDIAKIDRRLVALDADGAVRTVRQDGIVASMVKAIQQQEARIDAVERRLSR